MSEKWPSSCCSVVWFPFLHHNNHCSSCWSGSSAVEHRQSLWYAMCQSLQGGESAWICKRPITTGSAVCKGWHCQRNCDAFCKLKASHTWLCLLPCSSSWSPFIPYIGGLEVFKPPSYVSFQILKTILIFYFIKC